MTVTEPPPPKVIILCGGRGSRLHEQTDTRPKPMVEVGGKPLLWHVMKHYAHHGMREFILCLGYKGEVVKRYFLDYEASSLDFTVHLGPDRAIEYHGAHHESGWKVTLADTGEDVQTGARIGRAASKYLGPDDQTFAVAYGDSVSDVDLGECLAFHRRHKKLATVTGVRPTSRFGELHIEESRVISFSEKPRIEHAYISGGFFFFERAFLRRLSVERGDCVLEREPLERAAADRQLEVFAHHGYWQCMDTFRDWEALEAAWDGGRTPWKVWK